MVHWVAVVLAGKCFIKHWRRGGPDIVASPEPLWKASKETGVAFPERSKEKHHLRLLLAETHP